MHTAQADRQAGEASGACIPEARTKARSANASTGVMALDLSQGNNEKSVGIQGRGGAGGRGVG